MRTVRTKVFKFEELNPAAKEVAIEEYLNDSSNDGSGEFYFDEIRVSVDSFCETFNLRTGRTYSDLYTGYVDDTVLNLSGIRLLKYLINNYGHILFAPKAYHFCRMQDGSKLFNCVGFNGGKYVSKVQIEVNECPLTGVCYDMDILQPLYNFIAKPDKSTTFEDLINQVENSISELFESTETYLNSSEYATEILENNDQWEFTRDGKMFY